jgi:23S rRNA pseudouridine955/2504/2580 synthase
MRKITIDDNEKNQRFDRFVGKYLNKAPNSFIQKMIRKKNIELNGKKSKPDVILEKGDIIEFYLAENTINKFREEKDYIKSDNKLNLVYEDENLLIINKPAGITMQPDSSNNVSLLDMMLTYLEFDNNYKSKTFRPAFINRLDKNTSGIVVGAKNYQSLKKLNKIMRNKNIKKYYKGIVEGHIEDKKFLEDYITRENKVSQVNSTKGKKIITKLKPLKFNDGYTLVEFELVTGRTHQIRAHMDSIGHPLLGDKKYSGKSMGDDKYYYLHAYKIEFKEIKGDLDYLNDKSFVASTPERFKDKTRDIFGD